jgi:hypothetical protein
MSQYTVPSVNISQDFQESPNVAAPTLSAYVCGGVVQAIRFAEPTEQPLGALGAYNPDVPTSYVWPNRQAGGLVDPTSVQLWVNNAILNYYSGAGAGVKVINGLNKIRIGALNLATNGSFTRNAVFGDRDVAPGDVVQATFATSPPVTVWSTVQSLLGDAVASALGTTTKDSGNNATTAAATSFGQTSGPINAVEIASASATAYNPYLTGRGHETYTIIVTSSSMNGNFPLARLQVISASGLDNQASVTPAAHGSPTAIGTLGATVTFTAGRGSGYSLDATEEGLSPDDLLAGQTFTLTVTATFTAIAAPTVSGTYTGTDSTTYIVTVSKGNKYATAPAQITVTTIDGSDISGPTNVTAAATPVVIGNFGVSITFAGLGLALGDRFYVPVTAAGTGQLRTLVLGNTIPSSIPDGTVADISLYILEPTAQINIDRLEAPPLTNYASSTTQITVPTGVTLYTPSWTVDGIPEPLPLASGPGYGNLFVQYTAWLPNVSGTVSTPADLANLPGPLDPINPLKWALAQALTNSNGVPVYYQSVTDPTNVDDWQAVLSILETTDGPYGLVPLTHNTTVLDLFEAYINTESSSANNRWCVLWASLSGLPTVPIVSAGSTVPGYLAATTSDGNVALATVVNNPNEVGTNYTMVTVTSGNAVFTTNNVQAGDILRINFTTDGFGDVGYSEYVVDSVLTQETLILLAGPAAAINVASKIEVWRNLSADAEAAAIGQVAAAYANRRVRAVWPDTINTGTTVMDGFHLCAALAGLRSGVLPQQGLTRVPVQGFTSVPRTTQHFNRSQLDVMAGSGVWIVTQNAAGTIYNRHAVTTGPYSDINQREEMVTSNVDSICQQLLELFNPYIGLTNVTANLIGVLRLDILALSAVLTNASTTPLLGGQLTSDIVILSLQQSPLQADHIQFSAQLPLPAPFNNADVDLLISTQLNTTATVAAT